MNIAAKALALALLASPLTLCAQEGFGKLDPAPPTGHTVDEIIQKFGQQESAFKKAREQYTFRQSVKIDTLDEDTNKVDGEWQQVTDIVFDPDGKRTEHVVFAPANTLERIMLQQQDLDDLERGFPFVLTAEQLPKFNITYLGRQKVDELDTYVFSVVPKVITVKDREFEGKVWVDQQELQIVLINGKIVPDDFREGHENMSPPFSTYYEQIDGKYWFPTYTKADAEFHIPATRDALADDIHVKAVVKYTDYKQFHATSRILFNGEDITNNHPSDTQPSQTPPTQK
ncbi:MAG TPA: hypothetical protein VN678_05985 [Acidobacteriaceae bacterium]|nr:hypothetical protein [Acidobacteriaceae bacterium]